MSKFVVGAVAALLLPASAFAQAQPAPAPEKCCCDKMKDHAKEGMKGMKDMEHHDGADRDRAQHDRAGGR